MCICTGRDNRPLSPWITLEWTGSWSVIDRISGFQQQEDWDLQSATTTGMIVHGM